jgi:hypothetical protein
MAIHKRARLNPFDLQSVPGMPSALKIYRIDASPYWQVRLFVEGRLKRKTTQCTDRRQAIEFAKNFYDSVRLAQRLNVNVHTDKFHACAKYLIARQTAMVAGGQRDGRINKEDEKKLNKDILPFFATKAVSAITAADIQDYVDQLTTHRQLTPSTIAKHIVVIRRCSKRLRGEASSTRFRCSRPSAAKTTHAPILPMSSTRSIATTLPSDLLPRT